MSKIIITECNLVEKPGKTAFYACKDSMGNKMSCWDAEIATFIQGNLNKEIEVTLKTAGNFVNIRAVDGMAKTPIEVNPSQTPLKPETIQKIQELAPKSRPLRDDSIVAQVFVKGAVEMFCSETGTIEDKEKFLAECIQDLHKAYKLGVGLLEQNE